MKFNILNFILTILNGLIMSGGRSGRTGQLHNMNFDNDAPNNGASRLSINAPYFVIYDLMTVER